MTWAEALRRVETLKHTGIWPGIITQPDGTYRLTCDDPPPEKP